MDEPDIQLRLVILSPDRADIIRGAATLRLENGSLALLVERYAHMSEHGEAWGTAYLMGLYDGTLHLRMVGFEQMQADIRAHRPTRSDDDPPVPKAPSLVPMPDHEGAMVSRGKASLPLLGGLSHALIARHARYEANDPRLAATYLMGLIDGIGHAYRGRLDGVLADIKRRSEALHATLNRAAEA